MVREADDLQASIGRPEPPPDAADGLNVRLRDEPSPSTARRLLPALLLLWVAALFVTALPVDPEARRASFLVCLTGGALWLVVRRLRLPLATRQVRRARETSRRRLLRRRARHVPDQAISRTEPGTDLNQRSVSRSDGSDRGAPSP